MTKLEKLIAERDCILEQIENLQSTLHIFNVEIFREKAKPFDIGDDVYAEINMGRVVKYKKFKIIEENGEIYLQLYDVGTNSLMKYKRRVTDTIIKTFKKV